MTDESFDPDFATSADWARLYRRLGFQVLPGRKPRPKPEQWKVPALKTWSEYSKRMATDEEFDRWFPPGYDGTLCIVTGFHASGRRWMISDGDRYHGPAHDNWWNEGLITHNNGLDIETVRCVTGGGGIHRWFWLPDGVVIPNFTNKVVHTDGRELGGQGVTCPSRHDSGGVYAFEDGYGPLDIEMAEMPMWLVERHLEVAKRAGASIPSLPLDAPSLPLDKPSTASLDGSVDDGREHLMTQCVWGALTDLRQLHDTIPSDQFVAERDEAYERYEAQVTPRDRDRAHGTKTERLEREGRGHTLWREKWVAGLRQWDTKLKQHAANPTTPANKPDPEDAEYGESASPPGSPPGDPPKPLMIADPFEEIVVPDFPTRILPPKLQQLTRDMSDAMGADPNTVAMCLLAAAGAALDQRFRVDMQKGGDFQMPPRIWPLLIGDPSTMKTPVISATLKPLFRLDADNQRDYSRAYAQWKEQDKDSRGPEPAKPTRYVLEDATTEKLHAVCADQDRGVAMMLDEMSKFSQSGKASRGGLSDPDRAMYAKFFDSKRYVLDRIGRGTVVAELFGGTIMGGLQPDTLSDMQHLADNGLLQRFCPIIVRSMRKSQSVDYSVLAIYWDNLLNRLTTLQPVETKCTPEAERLFMDFGGDIVDIVKYAEASNAFRSAMGKLRGLVGSIALILHLIEGRYGSRLEAETAQKAIDLCTDFIIPHQLAFYEMCEGGAMNTALGKTAAFILSSNLMRLTPRDLTMQMRSLRGKTPGELANLMSQLVSMGWLQEEMDQKGYRAKAWLVRQGLREHFDERRRALQAGRARTAELLKGKREAARQVRGDDEENAPRTRTNNANMDDDEGDDYG